MIVHALWLREQLLLRGDRPQLITTARTVSWNTDPHSATSAPLLLVIDATVIPSEEQPDGRFYVPQRDRETLKQSGYHTYPLESMTIIEYALHQTTAATTQHLIRTIETVSPDGSHDLWHPDVRDALLTLHDLIQLQTTANTPGPRPSNTVDRPLTLAATRLIQAIEKESDNSPPYRDWDPDIQEAYLQTRGVLEGRDIPWIGAGAQEHFHFSTFDPDRHICSICQNIKKDEDLATASTNAPTEVPQ